jgi:hypothetical protein
MADAATAPHAGGVLVVDDSGDRKDGHATAHVARQYLGSARIYPDGKRATHPGGYRRRDRGPHRRDQRVALTPSYEARPRRRVSGRYCRCARRDAAGWSWASNKPNHSQLKHRLRPMRGLRTDATARAIIAGHPFMQNLRHGHYELGLNVSPPCGSLRRLLCSLEHSTFAVYAAASAHARWTWRISALVG